MKVEYHESQPGHAAGSIADCTSFIGTPESEMRVQLARFARRGAQDSFVSTVLLSD